MNPIQAIWLGATGGASPAIWADDALASLRCYAGAWSAKNRKPVAHLRVFPKQKRHPQRVPESAVWGNSGILQPTYPHITYRLWCRRYQREPIKTTRIIRTESRAKGAYSLITALLLRALLYPLCSRCQRNPINPTRPVPKNRRVEGSGIGAISASTVT
jgi:hypothetical protein